MSKTNIRLPLTDRLLEIFGVAGMVLLIALPVFYFNDLPDTIPVHFNLLGEPDRYGSRNSIWALPAIGLFLFVTIIFIPKMLIHFNNTDFDSEEKKYRFLNAMRMVRLINMLVVFMFSSITYYTILISLGNPTGLWNYSTLFFLLLIFVVIIVFIIRMKKMKI
jgi:uncharacterized membrane protein